jgi:hypothetical protein
MMVECIGKTNEEGRGRGSKEKGRGTLQSGELAVGLPTAMPVHVSSIGLRLALDSRSSQIILSSVCSCRDWESNVHMV